LYAQLELLYPFLGASSIGGTILLPIQVSYLLQKLQRSLQIATSFMDVREGPSRRCARLQTTGG